MPWIGWVAIVAIIAFAVLQLFSMITGRPIPWGSGEDDDGSLEERIEELEQRLEGAQIEGPRVPTRSEENLAAEDRWRLDMLETRLENLESRAGDRQSRPDSAD